MSLFLPLVAVRGKCMVCGFTEPTWLAFNDTRTEMNTDDKLICLEKLITERMIMHPTYTRGGALQRGNESAFVYATLCFGVCLSLVTDILRGQTATMYSALQMSRDWTNILLSALLLCSNVFNE